MYLYLHQIPTIYYFQESQGNHSRSNFQIRISCQGPTLKIDTVFSLFCLGRLAGYCMGATSHSLPLINENESSKSPNELIMMNDARWNYFLLHE